MANIMAGRGVWLVAGLLLYDACDLVSAGDHEETTEPRYGQTLLAQYALPRTKLDELAQFRPSTPAFTGGQTEQMPLAHTSNWHSPPLDILPATNPYTIVVSVAGRAREDGAATTLWQAGWQHAQGITERHTLNGLTRNTAKAGEVFRVTQAAAPGWFDQAQQVNVWLGLMQMHNVELDDVTVQVWSGLPQINKARPTAPFWGLAIAGTMLLLWQWWARRVSPRPEHAS
ncbi:hypothetical protein N8I74_09350 [Chitiniphilus purpureus]|uniref:SURF1-like protein n=1 Tax=Chitiniphilus purpureus TaxID=2981137 RepID=A0ABY6DT44_9NEIS|nr:hypothetical protein [Chitiniphilus sp. CD1]UXY17192.1 hypothetical protein N8I74_09350 [Chitiniphilus sp. CD1]